jgi:hypothetical protein
VPGLNYELGDSVVWLKENGDVVPPFSIRAGKDNQWRWNCGTPEYRNVIVFDTFISLRADSALCCSCGRDFAAVAVVVRNGQFGSIWNLTSDDVDAVLGTPHARAEVVAICEDGSLMPKPDWFDHQLDTTRVFNL